MFTETFWTIFGFSCWIVFIVALGTAPLWWDARFSPLRRRFWTRLLSSKWLRTIVPGAKKTDAQLLAIKLRVAIRDAYNDDYFSFSKSTMLMQAVGNPEKNVTLSEYRRDAIRRIDDVVKRINPCSMYERVLTWYVEPIDVQFSHELYVLWRKRRDAENARYREPVVPRSSTTFGDYFIDGGW